MVRESKAYRLRDQSDIYDVISSRIDTFLGIGFGDHCRRHVVDNRDCPTVGFWWDSDRKVDIVAVVGDGMSSYAMFGTCWFCDEGMPLSVYRELVDDVSLIRTDLTRRYVLFSISGFTDELAEVATGEGVVLIAPDELLG